IPSSVTSQRFGPTLFGPPLLKVWHTAQTLVSVSPRFGSALASSGSMGSSFAAAGCSAGAAATCSLPAGRKTGFSSGFGRTSSPARIPDTIATIIAVKTEAMILFHSNAGIDNLSAPNADELSRFRRSTEPGILSLPDRQQQSRDENRTREPDHP